MCGAFSGRATSTAAVGVVHDSFISYSDGRRHRWSHNPFCVNRHDIFQNSTAEQRQFNETPSQRHVFDGKGTKSRRFGRNADRAMKLRARRGCTQAARQADPATRSECAYPARGDAERAAREIPRNTLAWWRRLAQSGVSAHEPQAPPVPPSPRPRKIKNTQTKHP